MKAKETMLDDMKVKTGVMKDLKAVHGLDGLGDIPEAL